MITAIIKRNNKGEYTGFRVEGHAGFSEVVNSDKDLVCASVSVLVINTINALEALTDIGMSVEVDEKKGLIDCKLSDVPNEKEVILIDAMVLGIENIQNQYGKKFCKIRLEEV